MEDLAAQQLGKALNVILREKSGQTKFKTLGQYSQQPTGTNIFIRGLPAYMTDDCLYKLARCYGEIQSSKCIIDSRTQRCKGFGFVMFSNQEQAQACIDGLKKIGLWTSLANVQTANKPDILTPTSSQSVIDYCWGINDIVANNRSEWNLKSMDVSFDNLKSRFSLF
eukprot:NODE_273_length_12179_cov_0.492632.p6 type:complete len:167 gc:universal NODE_273_length_12179_cov_0.492632:9589-10089(+)